MKRVITEKEIEYIIDFIKPSKSIPLDSAISIVNLQKNRLRKQLKNQMIYPSIIDELKENIKKNYIESQIQPGESVGIIAAQSIGERQTQNSIDYDEEIVIKDNGKIIKIKIGEFIDSYMDVSGYKKIDEHSHVQECQDVQIMTISQDEKIQWQDISEISRHSPKGNLVKVTTESGRTVVSTLSHSHLKKEKRKVVPVLGSDLKLGDRIPVIKRSPISMMESTTKVDISEYINYDTIGPYEYDSDGSTPLSSPTNKNNEEHIFVCEERFSRYIDIDDMFIKFLGIFMANGEFSYDNKKITISSKGRYDYQIYEMIQNLSLKYNLEFDCIQSQLYFFQSFKNDRTTQYNIYSKIFTMYLKTLLNKNGIKIVPEFIFGLEYSRIQLFLFSYFLEGGFNCEYDSVNKDIQFLLTYFGIYSRIVNNKLIIQQQYKDLFYDVFGIEICKNNLEDNFHTLDDPVLDQEVYRLRKIINVESYEKIKINTYEELNDFIADFIVEAHKECLSDIPENIEYLTQLDLSDVVWEKITKLELIFEKDYNNEYVYDFSVKGNETFALFSGIVVHNTLNTFHKAGQSEKSVTVGVPRFSELLNATKTPKMVNCKIYFNDGNESVHDLRETIAHKLVHITLKNLIKSIKICMNKEEEVWYSMFKILYNSNFSEHLHCISIKLDNKIMFKYRLTIDEIAKQIESKYSDLCCVFSPPDINQLDIFVDVSNIQFTQKQLLFITPDNAQEIYLDECVQPLLEGMTICGIYGIQNIYYTQENDEWFVETDGSNFKKILGCSIVDMTRTISNNVWDIYEVLGIEAAREFLISEFVSIMDGINLCHVKLLVEKMTFSGTICSISRYTLRKEESGPMSKASFEETLDNYLRAAVSGDIERTRGVSASIICGKRSNIGTGMMDLRIDIKRLPSVINLFKNEGNVVEE